MKNDWCLTNTIEQHGRARRVGWHVTVDGSRVTDYFESAESALRDYEQHRQEGALPPIPWRALAVSSPSAW